MVCRAPIEAPVAKPVALSVQVTGGGSEPVIISGWKLDDAAAGGFTVSNGGLDIANTAAQWKTARISTSRSSGKRYIEFRCSNAASAANQMFGLCIPSFDVSSHLFASSGAACVWNGDHTTGGGFTRVDGAPNLYNANAPLEVNDVIALAADFDAGKIWLLFNNTDFLGNPSAGTNPQFTFSPAMELYGAISLYSDPSRWQVLASASNQIYSPPLGFFAWDA